MVRSAQSEVNIFLIGFSGSGKSTVGPVLASKLGLPYFDTDEMIVKRHKFPISWIFELKGERAFRSYEQEAIKKLTLQKKNGMVVALGGGAFTNSQNRRLINAKGISIYLRCNIPELARRLSKKKDRPLLKGTASNFELQRKIGSMMQQRRRSYELADMTISTSSSSTKATVSAIIKTLSEKNAND